jgi:hypothetical protein
VLRALALMSCDTTSNVAQPKFIAAVCVLFGVIPLVGGALLRAGKRPPQSLPYLISLLARRILLPLVDVAFDWVAVASYWSNGQIEEAVAILTFLIVGTLSLTMVSAFASTDDGEYQNLRSVKDEGPVGIACGCCAGIFQVGPLYLGGKAIRAWREVTDTRWRKEALYGRDSRGPTTQPMLNDFVALVANVKHFIHFEALFEGGPQLVLQASRLLLACTSSAAAAPTSSSTSAAACTSSTSSTASIHLLHHLHLRHPPPPHPPPRAPGHPRGARLGDAALPALRTRDRGVGTPHIAAHLGGGPRLRAGRLAVRGRPLHPPRVRRAGPTSPNPSRAPSTICW